ncbi:Ubiquitin-NA [Carex littledalei]|uniref:Ubiquitin-NA n=1 Tax=Carex littledalei TaxID=544730 RepID=A0A833W3H3_9POAL|nr:Ubiquitin-NA [Carex littledalei]
MLYSESAFSQLVLRLHGGAKKRKRKTYTKPKKIKHKHKKVKLGVLQFYKFDVILLVRSLVSGNIARMLIAVRVLLW